MEKIENIRHANLLLLIEEYGNGRIKDFSEKVEISETQISQWKARSPDSKSGKPRNISSASCRKIENKLALAEGWMDSYRKQAALQGLPESVKIISSSVPVVGRARLGDEDCYFAELEYPVGEGEGYIEWPTKDPNAYALLCIGDSMNPRIKHGEFVIIEPNHAVQPGDEVVIKDKKDRVMVKQFSYVRSGLDYFLSVNENYAPFSLDPKDIQFMHYVAGIAKSALHREVR